MGRVTNVSSNNFAAEVLRSTRPVVMDLYAPWCGPCRALAPVLERFAHKYHGRINFVKADVDEEPELAEYYKASGVPTLLIFNNGEMIDRVTGLPDASFAAKLESLAHLAVQTSC